MSSCSWAAGWTCLAYIFLSFLLVANTEIIQDQSTLILLRSILKMNLEDLIPQVSDFLGLDILVNGSTDLG